MTRLAERLKVDAILTAVPRFRDNVIHFGGWSGFSFVQAIPA
jgi:hypothetical protein